MSDHPSKQGSTRLPPSAQATAVNVGDFSPALSPARASLAGSIPLGSMLGKYRICAVLGHGGMGTVYAAEDPLIKRRVAIKVLPPELARDSSRINRLLAEAQAAGRLNHPNVVTIHEVDQASGTYYIVMEAVSGGNLQDYLARRGSPGWRAATRITAEACKALAAAHEMGLIHRDIKPANLLLTSDGHVKVADFGLARIEASGATMNTQPGAILGTPAFMSPEQCRGEKVDHRTDIYSLGCTYYAILTGKPPFEAPSSIQVMFAHCSSPIPDPVNLNPEVPGSCAEILQKALAKAPDERYSSAREMLSDLRAVLGGTTIASTGPIFLPTEEALHAESTLPALPGALLDSAPSVRGPFNPFNPRWIAAAAGAGVLILGLIGFLLLRSPSVDPVAETSERPAKVVAPSPIAQAPKPAPTVAVSPSAALPPPVASPEPQIQADPEPKPDPEPQPQASLQPPPPTPTAIGAVQTPPVAPAPLAPFIANSIGQRLLLIPAGKFFMGDDKLPDAPRHEVTITKPF